VGGNPETKSDPSGEAYTLLDSGGGTAPVDSLGSGSFITIASLRPAS
jgi:hypothetical protein